MTHNQEEKIQATEIDPEMIQGLGDEKYKTTTVSPYLMSSIGSVSLRKVPHNENKS